jgi:glycosyltransferase involved in cell wall biosynthesis/O-antigen/teichoic acid export membrane protein
MTSVAGIAGGPDAPLVTEGGRQESTARRRAPAIGDEALVVSATGIVSVVNYGYTLILLWLLPTREFAEVGSISALLLICGTVAGAALPWVLAQEVLRSRRDATRRRAAVTFCLGATVLQGAAAGLATCLIASHYASSGVLVAAFCSVFLIFMAATAAGYFQGLQTFRLIAGLRVAEVFVKVGAGVGLVALGAGAGGAIAGFALGAGVVAGVGLVFMFPHITWSWTALAGRHLWVSTQGLLAIQAGVAVLASMDVVIGSLVLGTVPALATYQAANILGRVPVFLGAALSIVVFPKMIAGTRHPTMLIRETTILYVMLCLPITMVTATLPAHIVGALFPARYGDVGAVLPWAALGGLTMGAVNLMTTYFQASGRFRRTTVLLGIGVVVGVALDVTGLETHGIIGLAMAVALGGALVTIGLCRETVRAWPTSLHGVWRSVVLAGIVCLPLWPLRQNVFAWMVWAAFCGVVFCLRSLLAVTSTGDGPAGLARPRVLHLGYEDPRRPGAGGGSVRTHEINSRLAAQFDITVVCARYRGSRTRVEDGVRYVHIGVPAGDFPEKIAYFALIPYALLRYRSDIVVEDFGAPVSSVAVPWMTSRPVVGVVQWLFADEKSRQYHLPFSWIEQLGVRSHRRLIAVSADLGVTLSTRNPSAEVTVIANGLDQGAFMSYDVPRSGIAYLGRLEIAQKGLDLLLDAYALAAGEIEQDLFLGGDGPDRELLEQQASRLGIADRVHFVGRVEAEDRFAWLAGKELVAMPSRYETFGMVAAESLAVGTPVVAFDIPCLRALVGDDVGRRVPAFDVTMFAEAMQALASDKVRRTHLGAAGPARVAELNWDELALLQGQVYRQLVDGSHWSVRRGPADEPIHRPPPRPVPSIVVDGLED